jgi:penicillin-binding protein 1A
MRFGVALVASSLVLTGAIVGAAPQVWRALNAHQETPVALPTFSGLSTRTRIMGVADKQIGVFELENSQPLDIGSVPDVVVAAVLAVEDSGFYRHKGVNLRALVRATLANFQYSTGRQGASTITQQVVKNEFLAGLPRDGRYKILQARYAVMLEKK